MLGINRQATRTALAVVVTVVATFAAVASSDDEATEVDDGGGEAGADDGGNGGNGNGDGGAETFGVGDVVELGDWYVQVHGVTDPYTTDDGFLEPDPGNRWVAVDTEVTNNSDSAQTVSSIGCFELLDSTGVAYNLTITADSAQPPDGEVAPAGGNRRGTLTYEVPEDAEGLQLSFSCDLFSSGSAIIDLG